MTYDLQGSAILLHGPPKIGKTSLASSFPGPVRFIATEPGHRYLPTTQRQGIIPIKQWDDFVNVVDILKEGKKPRTVVVDTIAGVYMHAKRGVCKKHGAKHPSDRGDFGRTIWDIIKTEFIDAMEKFCWFCEQESITVVMVDHTKEEEVETAAITVTKVMCAMPGQCRQIITAIPDHIWFLGYGDIDDPDGDDAGDITKNYRDSRALWLLGNNLIEAGSRDSKMKHRRICPLQEVDRKKKTGGYYQIVEEMSQ